MVTKTIRKEMRKWACAANLAARDTEAFLAIFAYEIEPRFCSRAAEKRMDIIADIREHSMDSLARHYPAMRERDDAGMFVPLDRDIKRRCLCSCRGYVYRLQRYFARGAETYEHLPGISVDEAKYIRTRYAESILGRKFKTRTLYEIPGAYILPKSKCFSKSDQWECTKAHEHDRCIVSAPRDRISGHLR